MSLTNAEKARILRGDYSALKRDSKPSWCVSERLTVLLQPETRHWDPDIEQVIKVPPREVVWIQVTHAPAYDRQKHQWVIRFRVHDKRENFRYPAPGGGYTTSSHRSVDKDEGRAVEAVDDETLNRFSIENRARFALERSEQVDAEEARRLLNTLAKIQREAAKLGVKVAPDLQAAVEAARERIVEHRKAA